MNLYAHLPDKQTREMVLKASNQISVVDPELKINYEEIRTRYTKGNYTEYEADKHILFEELNALQVFSLELIPGRNKVENLKPFVEFFESKRFLITFNTEHNTPLMEALTVKAGNAALDEYLLKVSYKGACVISAHQYFRSTGESGYLDSNGNSCDKSIYVSLGNTVIQTFINSIK
ncbi:hypothetical protein ACFLT1_03895 [Bacteroidota bacterium]